MTVGCFEPRYSANRELFLKRTHFWGGGGQRFLRMEKNFPVCGRAIPSGDGGVGGRGGPDPAAPGSEPSIAPVVRENGSV